MICRCGTEMKDFDGVNFQCTECNLLRYKDDYQQERWLEKHGGKRCPVCGHIALQPGMLPNNGNGYVCLNCKSEYEHDEDSGRYDIYPLSRTLLPEKNHHGSITLKIGAVFWIFMIYFAGCAVIVKADVEALEIEFESDPFFEDYNDPVNIDNMTDADTVLGEWERDLGDETPNGTYYGPLLPPALFDHNIQPAWVKNNTVSNFDGRYTFVLVSGHFNLSAQKIMAGASEWWLRTPIHPESIEAYYGLTLSIFKDVDNASKVRLYGNYTSDVSHQGQKPRATFNGYAPDVVAEYGTTSSAKRAGEPLTNWRFQNDMRVANNRLYIQVSAVLEPSVDYVLSLGFRLPKEGNLYTYWTTSESPAGRWTAIDMAEMFMHPAIGSTAYIEKLDSYLMEQPMDLDWSFIFVEGVGMGGLFGKKLQILENQTLAMYPFFNTSMSGDQYMSFMLPFISNQTVNITPQVYNADYTDPWNFTSGDSWFSPDTEYAIGLSENASAGSKTVNVNSTEHLWVGMYCQIIDDDHSEVNFIVSISGTTITLYYSLYFDKDASSKNARLWCMIPMGWDYADFVLFSTNDTIDWATFTSNDRWNVELEFLFNEPITLTLLCYVEDRPQYLWTEIGLNNTTRSPYYHPFTFGRAGDITSTYRLHYNVWCSARGTDGQWAMRNGTSSADWTYTHYFPRRIHLSSAQWEFVNDTDSKTFNSYWDVAQHYWDKGIGYYRYALWYGMKATMMELWNGAAKFGGYIKDGLSDVWEGFKRFGNWIYTRLVEFVGQIWNFINDVVDTIAGFWQSFKYVIAPIFLMIIVAGAGKMSMKILNTRGT